MDMYVVMQHSFWSYLKAFQQNITHKWHENGMQCDLPRAMMIFNDANASMAIPYVEEGILSYKRFCFCDATSTATTKYGAAMADWGSWHWAREEILKTPRGCCLHSAVKSVSPPIRVQRFHMFKNLTWVKNITILATTKGGKFNAGQVMWFVFILPFMTVINLLLHGSGHSCSRDCENFANSAALPPRVVFSFTLLHFWYRWPLWCVGKLVAELPELSAHPCWSIGGTSAVSDSK